MGSEKKELVPLQLNNELALRSPQSVMHAIVEFNRRAYEFFETERLLQAVNEKFFNNKGALEKPHPFYGVTVNEPRRKERGKKSRFDRFFAASADLSYTSLRTSLSVKSKDLPTEDKSFDTLALEVTHSVDMEGNLFKVYVAGEITFSKTRWTDCGMNWGDLQGEKKSFYLKNMGEVRLLSFTMANPPSPDKVIRALAHNVKEILEGYAVQGYIKLPDEKPSTSPEATQDPARQT